MRATFVVFVLLAIVGGAFSFEYLTHRRSGAEKWIAARERAARVNEVGDLPWEKPDWRDEFEWLGDEGGSRAIGGASSGPHGTALEPSGVEREAEPAPTVPPASDAEPREASGLERKVLAEAVVRQASGGQRTIPTPQPVDPTPVELVRCSLVLVDLAGRPLGGREVRVIGSDDASSFTTETDEHGTLELHHPAGEYVLHSGEQRLTFELRPGLESLELAVE